MNIKADQIYISKEPKQIPVYQPEPKYENIWSGFKEFVSNCFTLPASSIKRSFRLYMEKERRRNLRFRRQVALLEKNPKHMEVLMRCVKYKQRPPKKYRDKYNDVIRIMPYQRRFYGGY